MYSNYSCFRNSSSSAASFVASLSYHIDHHINHIVSSDSLAIYLCYLLHFVLSGLPNCLCSFVFLSFATLEHKNSFPVTQADSLKATIFNSMAFKLSLDNNSDKIISSPKNVSLKILYNVC